MHLPLLREVWDHPATERPQLEPLFAAAFHGIELGFLLLAGFIADSRGYIAKRPRVEAVADDIARQARWAAAAAPARSQRAGLQLHSRSTLPCNLRSTLQHTPACCCPCAVPAADGGGGC